MTILSYSRTRLQIAALLFSLSALGVLVRWWLTAKVNLPWGRNPFDGIRLEWIFPVAFLIAAAMLARIMTLLAGDLAAIKALPEGLQVTGFFHGRRVLPWDGLIGGHRVNYGNFMHRNRWFNVRYLVDGSTRAMRVPLILTQRPSGGQMSLPEKIDKARDDALGTRTAPSGERIAGAGFDPDAAIQRYLATRTEVRTAPLGEPAPAPAADPARPVRAAFGRKGLR